VGNGRAAEKHRREPHRVRDRFSLSAIVGILGGVVLANSRKTRQYVDPWVSMMYATPLIALGPLFILWMGVGLTAKVAVIFLTAVFPILINTVAGCRVPIRS